LRPAIACKKLDEVKDYWKKFDVLGIDEGQFFEDVSKIKFTKINRFFELRLLSFLKWLPMRAR